MTGIRGRVFGALAATAVVCTVLTVLIASLVLAHQARARRLRTLGRAADALAPSLARPATAPTVVRLTSLAGGRSRVLRGPRRAGAVAALAGRRAPSEGFATLTGPHRRVAYAVRDTPGGRVVLLAPSGEKAITGPPPGRTVVLAGAGGLVVALLLGAVLTRRLVAPVREMTAAADALARGEAEPRAPEDGPGELGQLGRSFNAMAADLHRAQGAERDFLASVSHELKTPLTAVRGYAEAIADGTVEPLEAAQVIGSESARLERLVGDLLDLARARRADFHVAREPVDLVTVAQDAVRRHGPAARELGVTLSADLDGDAPGVGDAGRALQVVSNLVENALRVARPGGDIVVRARPQQVTVEDDGPGLPAEDIPHAFERFHLHDRLSTDRPVGSGLGLALVAELTAGMGGRAEAFSPPGGPTRFVVTLDGRNAP